jgi:rRNA maturation endonuclease Nob1/tetratricopeptide (TPR) repeat protein
LVVTEYGENNPQYWGKPQSIGLLGLGMATTWVVDSNCFIHMGSMAQDNLIEDLRKSIPEGIFVTPGVHKEVRTVRFQRWKNKPNLLEKMKPILTTIAVDDNQIKGLASQIGERAAPQDVDLSLMVLASKLSREGRDVTLVTDDFKMTTTSQKVNLGFNTCPPSTFLQRLAETGPNACKSRFRSLSRRTRAAEMRYAISRVNEYDIQAKLTWMVDSLIDNKPQAKAAEPVQEKSSEQKLIRSLRKFLLGGKPKQAHMSALGDLPNICQPVSELDDYLNQISKSKSVIVEEKYSNGIEKISSVLERVGLGLAPLDEEMAEIAHRAMAGHLYRMESCLSMLAKMNGNLMNARLHLSRALHYATLIDDVDAEMLATNQLGLLALVRNKWDRAADLFETADRQALATKNSRLTYVVCAGMARFMNGDETQASKHLLSAQSIVGEDLVNAANDLFLLGKNLLAMDEAGLAIEVLDEAIECAIDGQNTGLTESLAEYLVLANNALTESESQQYHGLRKYLDDINTIETKSSTEFEKKISEIEEQAEAMSKTIDTSEEWVNAEDIFDDSASFNVLRQVSIEANETLIIGQHSALGVIAFWLPSGDYLVSAGQKITIIDTEVKVAEPPEDLRTEHNISALVAVKDGDKISFSANIEL